jgi:cob(I)alamin adenosyltransferase
MSIATKRGDTGQTGLAGGIRVSKSALRVESYGTIDELNSALGLARAICADEDLKRRTKEIQRDLFRVGSALATPPESRKGQVPITPEMVDALTGQVHELEAIDGLMSDWSLPGETAEGAAYDLARTICRRAERNIVRAIEGGEEIAPAILAYVNRLSDLLWLYARKSELATEAQSSLREMNGKQGPRWSRAW